MAADNIQLSGVAPVAMDSTLTTAPEYEEISVRESKQPHIQLTDNAAYGCKQ